jgi:DNA-directed RNA polymerase specialized sigma24 family protein
VIELRYFGGLTEEETAQAAGIPLGTLKNQLTFARTWLRRELTKTPKR